MGKRSNFDRNPRDLYPTPYKAVVPLLPHLTPHTRFAEPCCGRMDLAKHLQKHGHMAYWCSDIDDHGAAFVDGVSYRGTCIDALKLTTPLKQADCIITNPPFHKDMLFPLLDHFIKQNKTWLLLPADFAHNIQSAPYMRQCAKIVSIGRVKWFEGSKASSTDNFCWYLFDKDAVETEFFGR